MHRWWVSALLACACAAEVPAPPPPGPLVPALADEPRVRPPGAIDLPEQVVVAGCEMCMFRKMPATGCFWAVELEGTVYRVEGDALPLDHAQHGPEGMCMVKREVTVAGWIEGDTVVATRFDLLPFEPGKHAQPAGPAH